MKHLVVVDEPGKVSALTKGLKLAGFAQFEFFITGGHICFSPKISLAGSPYDDQAATERIARGQGLIERLLLKARGAANVWIATDPDTRGDLLACDLARCLIGCPKPLRVRLHALDPTTAADGFSRAVPIDPRSAWPGIAEDILDNTLGAPFAQIVDPEDARLTPNFLHTALVGALRGADFATAQVILVLPAHDRHGAFTAAFPVGRADVGQAQDIVHLCKDYSARSRLEPGSTEPAPPLVPWTYSEALAEVSGALAISAVECARSMYRLYESGKLSYPYSMVSGLTGEGLSVLSKLAERHGVRFDPATLSQMARQGAESPRPATTEVDIAAPLLVLPPDEAVLSYIARHLISCGQPHDLQRPNYSALPEWARGIPWERRVPRWLRPWPRASRVPRVEQFSAESVFLRVMLERDLVRPRRFAQAAYELARASVLDSDLQPTELALGFIERLPATLSDPALAAHMNNLLIAAGAPGAPAQRPLQLLRALLEPAGLWGRDLSSLHLAPSPCATPAKPVPRLPPPDELALGSAFGGEGL